MKQSITGKTRLICKALSVVGLLALTTTASCGRAEEMPQPMVIVRAEDSAAKAKDGSGDAKDGPKYSIDVILKTTSSEYWGYVEVGCLAYAKEHPDVKIHVKGASAETALSEQENILWTDLKENIYDAYVIAPLEPERTAELLKGTKRPVVALDTPIASDRVIAFCGTDNRKAAKAGAQEAVKRAKSRGWKELSAINIAGVKGDRVSDLRAQGYREGIEEAGGVFLEEETVYAEATGAKAAEAMRRIIEKYPEGIAMIVCNNDDMAVAALNECQKSPLYQQTVVLGFDGIGSVCERMISNDIFENYVTVAQNSYNMGYMSVEAAVDRLRGRDLRQSNNIVDGRTFIDSGFGVVTKDNAYGRIESLQKFWE